MIFLQLINPYSIEQIKALEDKANAYETWVFFLVFLVVLLSLVSLLQRLAIVKLRKNHSLTRPGQQRERNILADVNTITQTLPEGAHFPQPNELLNSGLKFKFGVSGFSSEKTIIVGQSEGTVKTHSTEVTDYHLTIIIRKRGASYHLEFRREGKVLILLPGSKQMTEMGARERFTIQKEESEEGYLNFNSIESNEPIRFRLGKTLTEDLKFLGGYFEFHFYTKDSESSHLDGNKEKYFFLKLYKIYPGYNTAKQNKDGLFPMLEKFEKV
ncbi:hypothetical protein LPTSP3_g06940 [Leptospira kobayashii]|uniref:Uncharacterized protein n=1 Tax=Leptospira kobayashii TaxID=1917830 RepID=A0ABM7UQP4_9LEPT|nr:hypothetical protein [Leptospira kobayashii]BDA77764.1 hypothetical protein LPTSP3_g06940 [Leptospira kobayashii]